MSSTIVEPVGLRVLITTRFSISSQMWDELKDQYADTQLTDEQIINAVLQRGINSYLHPIAAIFSEN